MRISLNPVIKDILFIQLHKQNIFGKLRLLIACMRLRILFSRREGGGVVKFLGYSAKTQSFSNFFGIFYEIFVRSDYYFIPETRSPNIIDCGGNIGLSVVYFKSLYPDSQITVFEPSPSVFKCLSETIRLNKFSNVEALNLALSDQPGEISFLENPANPGRSTSVNTTHAVKNQSKYVKISVPAARLSEYIKNGIDLLKMDIEGGEGAIFEDLASSGKLSLIKEIIFEYHFDSCNLGNKLSRIVNILEQNDFLVLAFNNDVIGEFATADVVGRLKKNQGHHFMIRARRK